MILRVTSICQKGAEMARRGRILEGKKWEDVIGERCKSSYKEKREIKFRRSGKWFGAG